MVQRGFVWFVVCYIWLRSPTTSPSVTAAGKCREYEGLDPLFFKYAYYKIIRQKHKASIVGAICALLGPCVTLLPLLRLLSPTSSIPSTWLLHISTSKRLVDDTRLLPATAASSTQSRPHYQITGPCLLLYLHLLSSIW